jgi:hypothetical protein
MKVNHTAQSPRRPLISRIIAWVLLAAILFMTVYVVAVEMWCKFKVYTVDEIYIADGVNMATILNSSKVAGFYRASNSERKGITIKNVEQIKEMLSGMKFRRLPPWKIWKDRLTGFWNFANMDTNSYGYQSVSLFDKWETFTSVGVVLHDGYRQNYIEIYRYGVIGIYECDQYDEFSRRLDEMIAAQ